MRRYFLYLLLLFITIPLWAQYPNQCFDFTDLDAPNVVCEYTEKYTYSGWQIGKEHIAVIEPDAADSVNRTDAHPYPYRNVEITPLNQVPQGFDYAIRLEDLANGFGEARVTYTIQVDTTYNPILVLHVAPVLEESNSNGAGCSFEILESQNPRCTNFSAQLEGSEMYWQMPGYPQWQTYQNFYYTDWTTFGINLAPYHGQQIRLQFHAWDCGAGKHLGMFYYVMECLPKKLSLSRKGCDSHLIAPSGFFYQWYKEDDPSTILATSQTFIVPSVSSGTYVCDCSTTTDFACGFTLSIPVFPLYAKSQFEIDVHPGKCMDTVWVKNTSFVYSDSLKRVEGEQCTAKWNFGDGVLLDGTKPDPNQYQPTQPILYNTSGVKHILLAATSPDSCNEDFSEQTFCVAECVAEDTSVCQGHIISGQQPIYRDTTVVDTLVNRLGCDSIITTNIHVISPSYSSMDFTMCKGKGIRIYGHYYTIPGTYIDTIASSCGCDSIISIHITETDCPQEPWDDNPLNPWVDCPMPSYSTTDTAICYIDTPFTWFGKSYFKSGTYRDTCFGCNSQFCDSIGTLKLYVSNPPTTIPQNDTASCQLVPFMWRGHLVISDTLCYDTIRTTKLGCDSIYASLRFVVKEPSASDTTAYTCYGVPFIWHGKEAEDGDTIVRKNTQGCDSIVTLHLYTSAEPITLQQKDTASCNMVPFLWRGHQIVSDTLCNDTVRATMLGCDSIYASLRFVVKEPSTSDTSAYICFYDQPYLWHGKIAQDGDTIHLVNSVGCDSIVTLRLFVSEAPITIPLKDTASCQMVPFIWRGHTIVCDTTCYDTIRTTMLGCDSIYASLRFVVEEPSSSDTTAYVCYEDLPFIWHGKVAQNGDTIMRKNAAGCDSIITLRLTTSAPMQSISKDTTVCDTILPITWHGFEFNSVLIYRDTLRNGHGCDSLERIYIVNVIHCEPPVPPVPPTPTDTCLDSLVYKKWQDVIFCDNGRREFVAFQWYKDNQKMQGETKQYYFHEGGMGASEYFVEVTYANGTKRRTCPQSFDDTPRSADTYVKVQTVIRRGEPLHIAMSDPEADVAIYTPIGQTVLTSHILGPTSYIPIFLPTGVYVLLLHGPNVDTTTKIIVE